MKINILDAGISYRAGHHYDYGLKTLKHYASAGHDVHVYGLAEMDDATAADFAEFGEVTRLFRTTPYEEAESYDWYAGRSSGIAPNARSSPRTSALCERRMSGSAYSSAPRRSMPALSAA